MLATAPKPKIKKPEFDITRSPYKSDNDNWHEGRSYNVEGTYATLHACGTICGCGLGQLYCVTSFQKNQIEAFKGCLKLLTVDYKKDGIGAFIATLGASHWTNHEQLLLDAGFELKAEYNNWRHGATYKQRMYIYYIK